MDVICHIKSRLKKLIEKHHVCVDKTCFTIQETNLLMSQRTDNQANPCSMSELDIGFKKCKLDDGIGCHLEEDVNSKKRKIIYVSGTKTHDDSKKISVKVESHKSIYSDLQTFLCDMYIKQCSESLEFSELRVSHVTMHENPKIFYQLPQNTIIR